MTPPQDDDWWPLLERLLSELPDDLWGERDAVLQLKAIHENPPKEQP